VVSHAGVGLLREMAECTGLVEGLNAALIDTYKVVPVHAPGRGVQRSCGRCCRWRGLCLGDLGAS
jgi:hypothetical protein